MHPALQSGTVAIYARYSSDRQREASIEDQVRRCRKFVELEGGDADAAVVFSDHAVSGASLDRPGFEQLIGAVETGTVSAVVTEDLSRISRDFADSAHLFKRLQFAGVPLIGVADGIDTSARNAKLSFTVKSLVADLYLDDLRDKTLRGLEGRALAGYATGNTPFGYRTVPDIDRGRIRGHRIEIDEDQAEIVRRIFRDYRDGGSLSGIARKLNREGVPSPRAKTRHKRHGWGSSTIRAMLYNDKYSGTWKFKEREWVKVPGTNKRTPRARDPSEVMSFDRPELRIVPPDLWEDVKTKLATVKRRYTKGGDGDRLGKGRRMSRYLLSGILVCDACGAPMTILGTSRSYYRCGDNRSKGTCPEKRSIREEEARRKIIGMIKASVTHREGVDWVRKRIAEELRDYSKTLEAELKQRRERLARTEDRIRGLIQFIADGDRSTYIVETLHDLEAHATAEKTAIARLTAESGLPLRLPSIDEVADQVLNLDARLMEDVQVGRAQLQRWLKDERIRIAFTEDGEWYPKGALLPLAILEENGRHLGADGAEVPSLRSGGRI